MQILYAYVRQGMKISVYITVSHPYLSTSSPPLSMRLCNPATQNSAGCCGSQFFAVVLLLFITTTTFAPPPGHLSLDGIPRVMEIYVRPRTHTQPHSLY